MGLGNQSIHILRNLIIGNSGINLCSSDACVSHHLAYTFNRDTCRVTYTRKSCHFRRQKGSDNEAQDKNRTCV